MAETTREKLAREMTHWAPVESGPRVPDWLADLVRGASYLPYRLAGTPTDLGLLFTNAAGLTDPDTKYAGSSDWIIDLAAKHGLAAPQRGTTGELIGDIGGQIAMPGVSPAEMGAYAKALPFLLGTFGGMGAKTADTEKLAKAFELEQAGKPMRDVWQETGWFRAPWDQRWRFEIDDSAARLLPGPQADIKAGAKYLGKETVSEADIRAMRGLRDNWLFPEFMEHPQAVAAYPRLENTRVELDASMGGRGSFDSTGRIAFSPTDDMAELRSTMLHEPTHLIQLEEGFAAGGNPGMMGDVLDKKAFDEMVKRDEALTARFDELAAKWRGKEAEMPEAVAKEAAQLRADIERVRATGWQRATNPITRTSWTDEELHQAYRRLAGEAEARLVQARRDLTPEMRGLLYPLEQMDTMLKQEGIKGGIDDLIVRYGDGQAMSIPDELPSWAPPERLAQWRKARENAALPVEQGGLGLGPANTAAERAKAGGYDTPAVHATTADVTGFDLGRASKTAKYGPAVYMGKDQRRMDLITNAVAKRDGKGVNLMPLLVNKGNTYDAITGEYPLSMMMREADENPLRARGFDTVEEANSLAAYDPAKIRSRFAAFDPLRRGEADLLASWLLPLVASGGLLGSYLSAPSNAD